MVNISLSLDHSDRIYNPGDVINLEARVQVSSEQKFRSIYARIKGYAHVSWTESRQVTRNGKSHTEHTTYSSNESFFEHYQTLAGTRSGIQLFDRNFHLSITDTDMTKFLELIFQ